MLVNIPFNYWHSYHHGVECIQIWSSKPRFEDTVIVEILTLVHSNLKFNVLKNTKQTQEIPFRRVSKRFTILIPIYVINPSDLTYLLLIVYKLIQDDLQRIVGCMCHNALLVSLSSSSPLCHTLQQRAVQNSHQMCCIAVESMFCGISTILN